MKFAHISDLHIGKYLKGYSLLEDQRYILKQIIQRLKEARPDALMIAGDIYDKSVPSGEAFSLFDDFLGWLDELPFPMPVLIIAGNHDSPERLDFASSFLERHHIYISTLPPQQPDEYLKKISLQDSFGNLNIYLLPFTKPGDLKGRGVVSEEELTDYQSAVQALLHRENIDWKERNVLISHQFYQGGDRRTEVCDSELASLQVGGLEVIDSAIIKDFDYVALGHIHGSQQAGYPNVRYSGTPLKYSVSEVKHWKSITIVTIREKGEPLEIQQIPLVPLREVREETGKLEEIRARISEENKDDYFSITLTDETELYRPKEALEYQLSHLLELRFENQRTRSLLEGQNRNVRELQPREAFAQFFQMMQCRSLNEEEQAVMDSVFEHVLGEDTK